MTESSDIKINCINPLKTVSHRDSGVVKDNIEMDLEQCVCGPVIEVL